MILKDNISIQFNATNSTTVLWREMFEKHKIKQGCAINEQLCYNTKIYYSVHCFDVHESYLFKVMNVNTRCKTLMLLYISLAQIIYPPWLLALNKNTKQIENHKVKIYSI